MSDPVALVCVHGSDASDADVRRWRRRARSAHDPRAGGLETAAAQLRRRSGWLRSALLLLVVGGAGWAGASGVLAHSGGAAFSRRVSAGCEELERCVSLEAEAARRRDACVLFCDREAAELATVRQMRFRAEERRAVLEHYRERDRAERLELERERDERQAQWQREQLARAREASREQRHRLELERLRQEHIDRRLAEERQRRVGYFAALGPDGRALRLKRCLARSEERCDALVLDLIDAAADEEERRALAEANEGVVRAPPAPERPAPAAAEAPDAADAAPSSDPPAALSAHAPSDGTALGSS